MAAIAQYNTVVAWRPSLVELEAIAGRVVAALSDVKMEGPMFGLDVDVESGHEIFALGTMVKSYDMHMTAEIQTFFHKNVTLPRR